MKVTNVIVALTLTLMCVFFSTILSAQVLAGTGNYSVTPGHDRINNELLNNNLASAGANEQHFPHLL